MRLLESPQEFTTFKETVKNDRDLVLVPVFVNQRLHPASTWPAFYYVYRPKVDEGVGISFGHPELQAISHDTFQDWEFEGKVWVPDKKAIMGWLPHLNLYDVGAIQYVDTGDTIDSREHWPTASRKFIEKSWLTIGAYAYMLPLYHHMEYGNRFSRKLWSVVTDDATITDSEEYKFLNEVAIPALSSVEYAGLKINSETIKDYFPKFDERFIRKPADKIYSEYNLFTQTGRPSCRFGGINFAALNKRDGSRSVFETSHNNGMLVLLDFESYHLRLIANMINYSLPTVISAHSYFGQYYFGTSNLTDEQYDESKKKTFALLYGTGETDIPFFLKVREYQEQLWERIQNDGYIETRDGTKRIHLDRLRSPNPSKVFNYLIQFTETARNLTCIHQMGPLYRGKQSQIILYTYDSLLIDFSMADGKDLILETIKILRGGDKYPVRAEYGFNFHDLKPFYVGSNV